MKPLHLLLVDASGVAYRAFATANPVHRPSDGEPIGAVLGFMKIIWRMLGAAEADLPTHGAAIFDAPGGYFRHELYPAYKGNRPPTRDMILESQLQVMRLAADALGLRAIEKQNFEADDIIATLAAQARRLGIRTTIVSSDKDFGQLVVDGHIEIVDPLQKRRIMEADIMDRWGVPPPLVTTVQALAGDTADHIPGVEGIGIERAAGLVRRFGHLSNILAHADEIRQASARSYLKRKHRHGTPLSKTGAEWVRTWMELVTLRQDVELDIGVEQLKLEPVMRSHLDEILRVLEAKQYMHEVFGLDPKSVRVVDPVPDPLAWWKEELKHKGQKTPEVPQCGFYQRVLVKGGAYVAARIWREPEKELDGRATGMELMRCEVGGKIRDPYAEWVRLSMGPISEKEYRFMVANADHAKKWRPDDPRAAPEKKPDITKAKAPVNPSPKRRRAYDRPA